MAATRSNPKIVVSYRRSDSAMAGRIFDRLEQRFGKTSLFIDIDNIPYGVDFHQQIEEALKSSDLLVAIVGATWRGARDGGAARIMSEDDPVRVEIETAFARKIKVLPVLLDNAKMPEPQDLPDSIKNFAYLNAVEVESGRDFKFHADRLIGAVENSLGLAPTHGPRPVEAAHRRRPARGAPRDRALALARSRPAFQRNGEPTRQSRVLRRAEPSDRRGADAVHLDPWTLVRRAVAGAGSASRLGQLQDPRLDLCRQDDPLLFLLAAIFCHRRCDECTTRNGAHRRQDVPRS